MDRSAISRAIRCIARPGRIAALALGLLSVLAGRAEAQGLQFRHLRADEGLAGEWVQAITQDHRGFMWFGTATGLSRYNGYTMETYRSVKGDSNSIANNGVFVVREDRQGVIWAGTRVGLARYDRARNNFTNFMLRPGDEAVNQRQVQAILDDSRGTLWVGTTHGLYRFDRKLGVATPFRLPTARRDGAQVVAIIEDRRKHLIIATENDGLFDLDLASGALRQYAHEQPGASPFPSNNVQGLLEDSQGRLWVATYETGLVQLNPKTGSFATHAHDPRNPNSVATNHVSWIVEDRRGLLWLATENGGLERFDPETGIFTHFRHDPNNPLGISSDSFYSLYVDATGTLWAGTFSGGVDILRPSSVAIQRYSTIGGDTTSLSHNSVIAFAQDSSGMVWVATDGGGLNRLDPVTGRMRRYTTKNTNLNKNAVLAAAIDKSGNVWTGAWEGGLSKFDPRTERFTTYTTKNSNIPDNHIFGVHVDRKNRIWVGTWTEGLALFDPVKESFTTYHYSANGESQIWIIRELHDGRLAMGTPQSGMLLFDPETKRFVNYGARPIDGRPALSGWDVRALSEESPGVLWVGTSSGLDRLDVKSNTVQRFSTDDGLASDLIDGLEHDTQGNLWVSSDAGLSRYDYKSKSLRHYTAADGLQARQFAARSSLRMRDGALLFGGASGFNLIRPDLLLQNTQKPKVVFTDFQIFNKPVEIGAKGSPLQSHITDAKQINLTYKHSVFTIEFAGLDFTAPTKNRYKYKLEGFDKDWTDAGTSRSATYTNLPPDNYVFRVQASNNDGVWNTEGASINIEITPPFWQTWWFRALVLLSLTSIIVTIVRSAQHRHRALQAMNEQLGRASEHDRESQQYLERNVLDILGAMQKFSTGDYSVALDVSSDDAIGKLRLGFNSVVADRKRAEEELRQSQKMEAVGRLAGGVAHDFNNLLTVIKGNAELGLADLDSKEAVREELEEIERAAERASSLTRQLLAFSRKQILKPQTLSLNEMIVEIGRMLRRTVGEDIELKLALEPLLGSVRADPGQIEQVVLNLVVNARDAMPRGGELVIETRNVEAAAVHGMAEAENIPYVAIFVRDTGTGMAPSVKERVFEPFFTTKEQGKGTGLGLSTVYGSVKQSGGFVRVESEEGQGTTLAVYLPRVTVVDEPRVAAEIETGPPGTATVLLVEDEDAVRKLASRVLTRAGYTVLPASCGDNALEVAAQFQGTIDLLMTDVVMPGMSGRELAEQLMPRHPGMRLLYASGYTEDAIIRHGVSSQETAFLEKPFTPNGLLRKVRQVLDASAAEYAHS